MAVTHIDPTRSQIDNLRNGEVLVLPAERVIYSSVLTFGHPSLLFSRRTHSYRQQTSQITNPNLGDGTKPGNERLTAQ